MRQTSVKEFENGFASGLKAAKNIALNRYHFHKRNCNQACRCGDGAHIAAEIDAILASKPHAQPKS